MIGYDSPRAKGAAEPDPPCASCGLYHANLYVSCADVEKRGRAWIAEPLENKVICGLCKERELKGDICSVGAEKRANEPILRKRDGGYSDMWGGIVVDSAAEADRRLAAHRRLEYELNVLKLQEERDRFWARIRERYVMPFRRRDG